MPRRLAVLVVLCGISVIFMIITVVLSRGVSVCISNALSVTGAQFDSAHTVSNAEDRKRLACAADKETYMRMMSCVQSAGTSVSLYGSVIRSVIRWQGTLSNFVRSHNDLCPANKIL